MFECEACVWSDSWMECTKGRSCVCVLQVLLLDRIVGSPVRDTDNGPRVHVHQHRRDGVGQEDSWRGRKCQRPENGSIKEEGKMFRGIQRRLKIGFEGGQKAQRIWYIKTHFCVPFTLQQKFHSVARLYRCVGKYQISKCFVSLRNLVEAYYDRIGVALDI